MADDLSLMRLVDLWERRKSPRSQIGLARTRLCVRRFIDLVGDLEPHEVTRAHVIAYRDELENLPRMKSANIAEHLCKMHGLFNLALSEGLVSINPAHGIRARDFGIKLSAKRQGFTSTQVREIFKALDRETEAFGWVVRLLAYHGMRSGEACQLRSADVTVLHGVPVLRVHDLHGRVKNRSSIRDIPIHPACMDILRLAREVEAKHGSGSWLFPSLPVKELGRGRWFQDYGSRFLRHKVGITELKLVTVGNAADLLSKDLFTPSLIEGGLLGLKACHLIEGGSSGVSDQHVRAFSPAQVPHRSITLCNSGSKCAFGTHVQPEPREESGSGMAAHKQGLVKQKLQGAPGLKPEFEFIQTQA